jgi:hypothetical protein
MQVPSVRRSAVAVLSFGIAAAVPESAEAFERQWHLGAGAGAVAFADGYGVGPAVQLDAAYGISDMFDAKLELTASLHEGQEDSAVYSYAATGGLLYKLDVIEWVPYFGLLLGYDALLGEPGGDTGYLVVSVPLGIDYAFSRAFAVGLEVKTSMLFGPALNGTEAVLARAEYRWGF